MKQPLRFIVWMAVFFSFGMTCHAQKDVYNQIASMEYRQWKFTPEYYYYSWYMKKIDLGLFTIKTKVPGLGMHDNGPGGIGFPGDNYVNEPWRMMSPLRASTVAEALLESRNTESEKDYWNKIMTKDLMVIADRSTNLPMVGAKSVTADEREEISQSILDMLFEISELDNLKKYAQLLVEFRLQYDAINQEVDLIAGSNEDNSRRLRSLQDCNNRLRKLQDEVASAFKFIRTMEDPWMKEMSKVYPTSFRNKKNK